MRSDTTETTNTLRLNQRELHKLLEALEKKEGADKSPDREFVRWSYRVESVNLVIEHNSGNKVSLPVATRNISRGGISILHSAYMHTGTPCEILLKVPGGSTQCVQGTVKRCAHLTGRVHEIGIQFNQQISTKDLLGLDPLNEAYSLERVDPARLHGSVLIVTPSDMDRDLMLMYLEDTNLTVNTADCVENAVSRAQKGADIILADYHLGDDTAVTLIDSLSESGCDIPVIVLTSDKSEEVLDTIRESDAMGVLSKPATKDRVLQALAEFLHADGDGGPLYSTLASEDPTYPLLGKFLTEITRTSLNLEKAVRESDEPTALQIVRSLSGAAAPLGFPVVSELAIAAEKKLRQHGIKSAGADIRALVVACRRIKVRPAA